MKPYYQERHDLIESAGWTLLEIHYSSCYNSEFIEKLIDIKEQPDYTEYFKIKEERKKQKELNKPLPKGQKLKLKYEKNQ